MHRRRVVLLGTGTGVGKTYVASQLARAWRRMGIRTLALKPIESGVPAGTWLDPSSDAGRLKAEADGGSAPLYAFSEPVSPHLAAQGVGMRIDLRALVDWVWERENEFFGLDSSAPGGITLIESAGGAFSPLNEEAVNLDLGHLLQPALLVLIAPDSLGVLHDVGATLRAMAPTPPTLVALSAARPPDQSTGRNATELERIVFPRLGPAAPYDRVVLTISADEKADVLADRLAQMLPPP
jgi:dethiobiotin synthetase